LHMQNLQEGMNYFSSILAHPFPAPFDINTIPNTLSLSYLHL
jgi:hypothetical protein